MTEKHKYSVSLVFRKHEQDSSDLKTTIDLRVLITDAVSENEALGKAILYTKDVPTDYSLSNKVIIKIASHQQEEIEALRKQNDELYEREILWQNKMSAMIDELEQERNRAKGLCEALEDYVNNGFMEESTKDDLRTMLLEHTKPHSHP